MCDTIWNERGVMRGRIHKVRPRRATLGTATFQAVRRMPRAAVVAAVRSARSSVSGTMSVLVCRYLLILVIN